MTAALYKRKGLYETERGEEKSTASWGHTRGIQSSVYTYAPQGTR